MDNVSQLPSWKPDTVIYMVREDTDKSATLVDSLRMAHECGFEKLSFIQSVLYHGAMRVLVIPFNTVPHALAEIQSFAPKCVFYPDIFFKDILLSDAHGMLSTRENHMLQCRMNFSNADTFIESERV